jgi:CheY-like chemotaxis protein
MDNVTKPKVLLVDDERFLLEIYATKFLKNGFDVFACTSAEEGIDAIKKGYHPDAIIFDITMPGESGYELLDELHAMGLSKSCLKIALTNEGQDAETKRMAELGADGHLLKAMYTPNEIVTAVGEMLAKRAKG